LGSHFTRIIQVQSVQQLIDDDYLAACEYWAGSQADVSKVRTVNGDFETKGLSSVVNDKVLIGDVVDNWLRLASDRHTILFATDISHSEALNQRFQSAGVDSEVLHSKTPPQNRNKITDDFRNRRFQLLVNVGIATYGYDVPSVSCIVLARPTKSIVLHLQMIGRGMRPKEDGGYCVILDHAGNVRRLGAAEDEIRWSLDAGKQAATNYRRHQNQQKNTDEAALTTCEECSHMFSHSRVCPKCGWVKPLIARDIDTVDANLIKILHARDEVAQSDWPDQVEFFRMLKGHCSKNGYKPGWAAYKFREKLGHWPPHAWSNHGPIEPSSRVKNWILSRQIAYAKQRKSAAA
jgi:superfamily II DNA or RNA helicase